MEGVEGTLKTSTEEEGRGREERGREEEEGEEEGRGMRGVLKAVESSLKGWTLKCGSVGGGGDWLGGGGGGLNDSVGADFPKSGRTFLNETHRPSDPSQSPQCERAIAIGAQFDTRE